jgi:hypothetical protein
MNDTEQYIADAIRTSVWSGFYDRGGVQEVVDDLLEGDVDEELLRSKIDLEFAAKILAEKSWPAVTDCDRLDSAFAAMNAAGVIALQNAGYTMSDGEGDVGEVLHTRGRDHVRGYCFYHGQDLDRAVAGDGLMLAFGDLDGDEKQKSAIGQVIKELLERNGFAVEWDGDPERRIAIPRIDWKRRGPR